MVVALKDDRDPVLREEFVDRGLPARAPRRELLDAGPVQAAPLEGPRALRAASAGADDVVGEDELQARLALVESPCKPPVLRIADGEGPLVAGLKRASFSGSSLTSLRSGLSPSSVS